MTPASSKTTRTTHTAQKHLAVVLFFVTLTMLALALTLLSGNRTSQASDSRTASPIKNGEASITSADITSLDASVSPEPPSLEPIVEKTRLQTFIENSMLRLVPAHDHVVLSTAIFEVVQKERPLFRDDTEKLRTASLIVAVGHREGTLRVSVHGDCTDGKGAKIITPPSGVCEHPHSYCFLQIMDTSGGSEWLNENPYQCVEKGLAMLRESFGACPAFPISFYASGPKGCENARAQRISKDRMNLAHWLWTQRDQPLPIKVKKTSTSQESL